MFVKVNATSATHCPLFVYMMEIVTTKSIGANAETVTPARGLANALITAKPASITATKSPLCVFLPPA